MRDYSRQENIFEQHKLANSKIVIIGSSQLANSFCTYLVGLGIGQVTLFDDYNKDLESKLKKMNEDLDINSLNHRFDPYFIGKVDTIVDLTNSIETKMKSQEFAIKENIAYISASTSQNHGALVCIPKKRKIEYILHQKSLLPFKSYTKKDQGIYASSIIAAIALDETRKNLVAINGDSKTEGWIFYNSGSEERFSKNQKLKRLRYRKEKRKMLVVGAGGIGTFVVWNLAQQGNDIDIFDKDKVEGHNLNRQVFYYNKIGRNKANTLKERLSDLFPCNINSISENFTNADISFIDKYSAIFSCVDNPATRSLLNKAALRYNIPLIDTAVTAFSARMEAFIPGVSNCLACKRGANYSSRRGNIEGCATLQTSNVVTCNAFIGGMAASESNFLGTKNNMFNKKFIYLSKPSGMEKFRISKEENNSLKKCLCQKLKEYSGGRYV